MSALDQVDGFLTRLRTRSPLLGWSLTILAVPFALLLGLGALACVLLVGPAIPVIGAVWLAIYAALSVVGKYKEEYRPDKVMQGPAGAVILALGIVITILGLVALAQLPDRWLEHLFETPD